MRYYTEALLKLSKLEGVEMKIDPALWRPRMTHPQETCLESRSETCLDPRSLGGTCLDSRRLGETYLDLRHFIRHSMRRFAQTCEERIRNTEGGLVRLVFTSGDIVRVCETCLDLRRHCQSL